MSRQAKRNGIFLIAIAILFTAAMLFTTGCTRVEVSKTGTARGGERGVLRISTRRFDNLNTVVSAGGSSVYLSYLWGAFLFIADNKMNIIPELATRIPTQANGDISADGLTITYHLRRGVRWHDGAPFGADDVIFTWHAIMNPKNNVITRLGYDKIASMRAKDPYTLEVRLKERFAPAVATFFGPGEVPYVILPKHLLASLADINQAPYNRKPVGTGPFVIVSYDPASGVVLRANPHYWRGAPKLVGVNYTIVPDENTEMVMLRTDEIDVATVSDARGVQMAKDPGIAIVREPAVQNTFLSFNVQHPPLDDVRVRRAIAMGVNRQFFVHALQFDTGRVANGDQPPFYWSFDPNVRMPAYDPARAQRLLEEAGWHKDAATGYRMRDGKPLSLTLAYITARDPDSRYAPIFQSAMKEIGVAVNLKSYPYNVFYAPKSMGGTLNSGNFDMSFSGWVLGADPENKALWMCDQYPPNGYNWSFFCDKRIDEQERIALTSYDMETRRRAYWRIQELLAEGVPAIFLSWVDIVHATRDNVKDFHPGETWWASWNWRKD